MKELLDPVKLDRAVQALRWNFRHAVITPHCGDPIDIDVDEEGLFPWIVYIVWNALKEE